MANYKIYPLNLGKLIRNNAETPIVAFYLTDGVNKVIVDTGGVPADGKKFMPYFQEPGQRIEEALAILGVDPAEINIVINTHFHWDHMSNNHLFVNARHYVQRAEYQYALAPIPTDEWSFDKSKLIAIKWNLLDGDEQIADGLYGMWVGGHTPGSMCVIVDTEKGKAALTSDFITDYAQWEHEPKLAGKVYTDIVEYYRGIKKLEKACDYIIPGHNFEVLTHKVFPA